MAYSTVIKNAGPNNLLVWKYPEEDFYDNSQLIVMDSEEAVFVKDGVAHEVFIGGRYTLNTNNFPFINKLRNKFTRRKSPYNCKVFFVNKTHRFDIPWGTDAPIQLRDPVYMLQTSIMARGSYPIQIINTRKFLEKLVGYNETEFSELTFRKKFKAAFLQYIKDSISQTIIDSKEEILSVATKKTEIAERVRDLLSGLMEDYGINLHDFYISGIDIPDDCPNRPKLEKIFLNKNQFDILKDNWGKLKSADILMEISKNPHSGIASTMAEFGMGTATYPIFHGLASQMLKPMKSAEPEENVRRISRYIEKTEEENACPKCQAKNKIAAKYCSECGFKLQADKNICDNCKNKIADNVNFCPIYGFKQTGGSL